jgi:hypothetical protein
LSQRLWLPHHVALEFQRGRVGEIATQKNRFNQVKAIAHETSNTLQKKLDDLQLRERHSTIDPDKLIKSVEGAVKRFEKKLDDLDKEQPHVNDDDPIREKIDLLFTGRVGPELEQESLDTIFKEGAERYQRMMPPGYSDKPKENEDDHEFEYGGRVYRREYGDLILWKQLLQECQQRKVTDVLFVTDDDKEDWWWRPSGRTIGPRPELVRSRHPPWSNSRIISP